MSKKIIKTENIVVFGQYLNLEERSTATVEKYLRDVRRFAAWMDGKEVTKETVAAWKAKLLSEN